VGTAETYAAAFKADGAPDAACDRLHRRIEGNIRDALTLGGLR
jgi:hypothetical protein